MIKEINELRRELHTARRARSSPQHHPSTAPPKPALKPAEDRSPAVPAATAYIAVAPKVSSPWNFSASSAAATLAHGHLADDDLNNGIFEMDKGPVVEINGAGGGASEQFGCLAIGRASPSSYGSLEFFSDGLLGSAPSDSAAQHGHMAHMERSSLQMNVSINLLRSLLRFSIRHACRSYFRRLAMLSHSCLNFEAISSLLLSAWNRIPAEVHVSQWIGPVT